MDERLILARALPPPVDVAVDGFFAGRLSRELKQELRGWVLIAVGALALAGFLALILALARVPGADRVPFLAGEFFKRGLVAHVTFAFVVWYLGVQGAMTVLVTAGALESPLRAGGVLLGRAALVGAVTSFLLLLTPVLVGLGAPSLNNYIPMLTHPLYYGGLGLLGASVMLPVLRLLAALAHARHSEATTFGVAAAGVIFITALCCFALAWIMRPAGFDAEGLNEFGMWGGGHILQFANTALFLCAIYLLSRIAFGETPLSPGLFKFSMMLMVAAAAVGPLLYLTFEAGDPAQRQAFTDLYRFALPLPAGFVGVCVLMLLWRRRTDLLGGAPEIRGLVAAIVLFTYGGVIGFLESSVDTRTPAHYHAMLIAVTLMFMALTFAVFLPLLERRSNHRRLRNAMYLTLGAGQFLHTTGLFVAGALGVARKTAGAAQGLDSGEKIFAMSLMGLGGVIAVVGGVIFIVLAGKLLLAKQARGMTAPDPAGAHHA